MNRCEDIQEFMHAYIDGELDLVRAMEIERHLQDCGPCAQSHHQLTVLQSRLKTPSLIYKAPQELKDRLESEFRPSPSPTETTSLSTTAAKPNYRLRYIALAAMIALVTGLAVLGLKNRLGSDQLLAREVLSNHLRSLMATHLFDVESTDQHTVKPWFDGRLDFAPPVHDLAPDSSPLVGGRLDYLSGRPVAALVYRHEKHVINLFIWPAENQTEPSLHIESLQGYALAHWSKSGMNFWAISNMSDAGLKQFALSVQTK